MRSCVNLWVCLYASCLLATCDWKAIHVACSDAEFHCVKLQTNKIPRESRRRFFFCLCLFSIHVDNAAMNDRIIHVVCLTAHEVKGLYTLKLVVSYSNFYTRNRRTCVVHATLYMYHALVRLQRLDL